MSADQTRAQTTADGLEELAAWLREHPDTPVVGGSAYLGCIYNGPGAREKFIRRAQMIGPDLILGELVGYTVLTRKFTGGVELRLEVSRGVLRPAPPEPDPIPDEIRSLLCEEAQS